MERTKSMVVRVLVGAALVAVPVALSACSTVRGAGEDLQYASDKTAEALSGGEEKDAK
ncbi:MAG: entericidin A/B family lipoprotein [Phycisphaerales bacterium]